MLHRFALVALSALTIVPVNALALDANLVSSKPATATKPNTVLLPPQAQAKPTLPTVEFSNAPTPTTSTLSNAALNGNIEQAGTRLATNAVQNEATSEIAKSTGLSRGVSSDIANGALNGNLEQTGTRLATNAAGDKAATGLASATGLSTNNASTLTNAALNGNLEQAGTRLATNAAQNEATSEIAKSTGLSRGVSSDIANGALNGNLEQTGTRLATNAAGDAFTKATGVRAGGIRALFGGRGGEATSSTFVQKNDYIAETDDGIIRTSGNGKLSSALNNLGFGNATRLTLSPEGIIKDAAGQIAGRLDKKTGQLFDAAGAAIPSNTIVAQRMMENISQGLPSQPTVNTPSTANASGIPTSFNNSNWDEATRQKEWASLPAAQQADWMREAAVKANATTGGYTIPAGSNQILDANGKIVGRLSPSATSQFADASGLPISPNSPQYDAFKKLIVTR